MLTRRDNFRTEACRGRHTVPGFWQFQFDNPRLMWLPKKFSQSHLWSFFSRNNHQNCWVVSSYFFVQSKLHLESKIMSCRLRGPCDGYGPCSPFCRGLKIIYYDFIWPYNHKDKFEAILLIFSESSRHLLVFQTYILPYQLYILYFHSVFQAIDIYISCLVSNYFSFDSK